MPGSFSIVYLLLALIGTGINLFHVSTGGGVIKALPALFLTACAFAYSRPRFGLWMAIGVALGAVGDFSLASAEREWFLIGLGAFLAGHVAYSIALAKDLRWSPVRGAVIGVTVAAMAILLAAVAVRCFHVGEQKLLPPMCVYVTVMSVMMAIAVLHDSPTRAIAAGGVVFVVSDAHIALNHMLLSSPLLGIALSGYATYYLAQYLLISGAVEEARQWKA